MKDKIENLIKEIGIDEVEVILKQLKSKSKANVKENIKKDFVEILSNCTTSFNHNDVEYRKKDKLLFYYQKKENIFWIKYVIWSNFELKYNLNYHELKKLLANVVEDVLNYKGVTPYYLAAFLGNEVE